MKIYELQAALGIDALILAERPEPRPAAGQVLLKMRAWSINYLDLMVVNGRYPNLPLPMTPLSDGVGVVVEVGAGVSRVKPGDRVAGNYVPEWIDGELTEEKAARSLGGMAPGVAAEYVVLDAEGVVPVPEHLSDEEAATLPCAALTAWHALVASGRLKADDTVLTQGTGGVSMFALQFAQLLGARVIATSGSDAKLARLLSLGASDGVNYKTVPEWGPRVRELTRGVGVDHVVEVGGANTLGQSLRAVRMGGRISLIGILSGRGLVDPSLIPMKKVCVQGIYVGSRVMFEAMNATIASHRLRPIMDRVFPFSELPAAFRHLESGAHFGKIALVMD